MSVLDRLVGGDRRSFGSGIDEPTMESLAAAEADLAPAVTDADIDELPIVCVCPMLRDGWSRRASAAYSPFFDGDGVWSRSEAPPGVVGDGQARGVSGGAGGAGEAETGGRTGGEQGRMPIPTVVADVLFDDLSFSLR